MFIRSTNEYMSTPQHVYNSLGTHLGVEYADSVREILEAVPCGYTSDKEVEKMDSAYQQEIDSYQESLGEKDSAFSEIQELCKNLIENIKNSKRLSRKDIISKIEEIEDIAYKAY